MDTSNIGVRANTLRKVKLLCDTSTVHRAGVVSEAPSVYGIVVSSYGFR